MSYTGELAKFASGIQTNTIDEFTSGSGVKIGGILLKDNSITGAASGVIIKGGNGVASPTGYVGEYIEQSGSATAMTTGQYTDGGCSPITLNEGVWDVQGITLFSPDTGATVISTTLVALGTATGNSSAGTSDLDRTSVVNQSAGGAGVYICTPLRRYVVTVGNTRTVYTKSVSAFSVAGLKATSYLTARRVR